MRTAFATPTDLPWAGCCKQSHSDTYQISIAVESQGTLPCFRCFVCGTAFSSRGRLRNHENVSHRVFRCSFGDCQQSFMDLGTLRRHETTFHEMFNCSSCTLSVTGSGLIHKHLYEIHSQPVPFVCVCAECKIFFPTPADHAFHNVSMHRRGKKRTPICIGVPMELGEIYSFATEPSRALHDEDYLIRNFVDQLLMDVAPSTPEAPTNRSLSGRNLYQFDQID